jgi:hypothetical protein
VHLRKPLKDDVACAKCCRHMLIQTPPISICVLPHELDYMYFWEPDDSSKTVTSCAASAWFIPVNEPIADTQQDEQRVEGSNRSQSEDNNKERDEDSKGSQSEGKNTERDEGTVVP